MKIIFQLSDPLTVYLNNSIKTQNIKYGTINLLKLFNGCAESILEKYPATKKNRGKCIII